MEPWVVTHLSSISLKEEDRYGSRDTKKILRKEGLYLMTPPHLLEGASCETTGNKSNTKPRVSIHLPKGANIKHIDPNTIHKGGTNK